MRGPNSSIAVLTSASTIPDEMWEIYDTAFSELGVRHYFPIHADSRDQANEPERAQQLYEADGIFMTGGFNTAIGVKQVSSKNLWQS